MPDVSIKLNKNVLADLSMVSLQLGKTPSACIKDAYKELGL